MSDKNLPTAVKLSDGRTAQKKESVKVREIATASNQPKGKEYLIQFAIMAAKITIDEKQAVLEDVLDMTEDDFMLISSMFVSEDDLKNA